MAPIVSICGYARPLQRDGLSFFPRAEDPKPNAYRNCSHESPKRPESRLPTARDHWSVQHRRRGTRTGSDRPYGINAATVGSASENIIIPDLAVAACLCVPARGTFGEVGSGQCAALRRFSLSL